MPASWLVITVTSPVRQGTSRLHPTMSSWEMRADPGACAVPLSGVAGTGAVGRDSRSDMQTVPERGPGRRSPRRSANRVNPLHFPARAFRARRGCGTAHQGDRHQERPLPSSFEAPTGVDVPSIDGMAVSAYNQAALRLASPCAPAEIIAVRDERFRHPVRTRRSHSERRRRATRAARSVAALVAELPTSLP